MTKVFDANEVCSIIEMCGKSGVREFRLGKLEIHYGPVAREVDQSPIVVPDGLARATESQARESLEKDEIAYKQNELDQMVIEDPARFEELLKSGDLRDEET